MKENISIPVIDENTWIISDTHFGHKNIINFCNRPRNHEDVMFHNWASNVQYGDKILHLGDVAFGNRKEIYYWANMIKELPGEKYLIKGNHDHSSSIKVYKGVFEEIIDPFIQEFSDVKFYFSHYPDHSIVDEWDINIHGHIHNNSLQGQFSPVVDLTKIYENVSVEVTRYAPIRLSSILTKWGIPF
jgi:calcineurin-like phosphoesterase family protein